MKTVLPMKTLILILFIMFCPLASADSPNGYAKKYVVDKAKNCGDPKYGEDATEVKSCVYEKLTNIENFYVWFWATPTNTGPATGLILKDGELSIAWFDKVGKGKETYFLNHICDDWNLDPGAAKPVQCSMKKSSRKIYLMEMESFVELKMIP